VLPSFPQKVLLKLLSIYTTADHTDGAAFVHFTYKRKEPVSQTPSVNNLHHGSTKPDIAN
jgi:hypothetical protein